MNEIPWLLIVAVLPLAIGVVLAIVEVAVRPDLTVLRRVSWWLALVLVPPVALAVYAIVRPPRQRPGVAREAHGSERAAAMVALVEERVAGALTEQDYTERLTEIRSDDA